MRSLSDGGPAKRAGLRAGTHTVEVAGEAYRPDGDVIVAVGSTPVAGFRDLDRAIAAHHSGERVDLHIVRGGAQEGRAGAPPAPPGELRELRLSADSTLTAAKAGDPGYDCVPSGRRPQRGGCVTSEQRDGRADG